MERLCEKARLWMIAIVAFAVALHLWQNSPATPMAANNQKVIESKK